MIAAGTRESAFCAAHIDAVRGGDIAAAWALGPGVLASTIGDNDSVTAIPESHRDLLDARVATRATLRADGFPQVGEVWFLHDDGALRLSLNTSRLKTRNLRARPRCSLMLLDTANTDRYVEIRGLARLEPDEDYRFAKRLAAKYGGIDLRSLDGPGEGRVTVTIDPVHVYAVDVSWVLAGGASPQP